MCNDSLLVIDVVFIETYAKEIVAVEATPPNPLVRWCCFYSDEI